jgi:hypothetical protein
MNFNELAKEIHADNHMWWKDPKTGQPIERDRDQLLILINSELIEAMEGERKSLMDDHIPHRRMAEVEMADTLIRIMDFCGKHAIPLDVTSNRDLKPLPENRAAAIWQIVKILAQVGTLMQNNADLKYVGQSVSRIIKMLYQYCETFGYDLNGAMADKREFNSKRIDHTFAARLAPGGKKW